MIEEAIINLLLTIPELAAIVGDRIFPNIIKADEEYPAVYVAANRMEPMQCDNPMGMHNGVVEVGIFADDYVHCLDAMAAIRNVLNDYAGKIGNIGIKFQRGQHGPDGWDDELKTHIKVVEYEAFARVSSTN
ncbi:hypothetical protein [Dyadobacter fermentans]|uniref:hypothetical protein n=1 Tax=Dyadobacter fermentans TaxID=94254 RepID=UPI001CBC262B|nr:hypothetical protein [Dyadobacter fermentans]MBZ1362139.1 hypothetical protein [Dyadobacter fermentans]